MLVDVIVTVVVDVVATLTVNYIIPFVVEGFISVSGGDSDGYDVGPFNGCGCQGRGYCHTCSDCNALVEF
jgi:hypothetical protein